MEAEQTPKSYREIFDRAVELPVTERDEFLIGNCGSDVKLRAAVESLLTAHDRAGSFLADPVIPSDLLQAREQLSPGSRIDRYALIRVLGEGGHGTVYLAEQDPPLRRRVALKVIKPGMDTRQVIARFELERQVLAVLDHPNIAKVFDAGSTSAGYPFFVMEMVDGIPVTEFCRSHELDIAARLRLFMTICSAVHHAHGKGIVHRDLKPGNVLVAIQDGNPIPKVIDFGIAKALLPDFALTGAANEGRRTNDPITLQPQFLGTPQYMSPEQARASTGGDVDWRSDIYSLGALLYELLTDVPPFDKSQLEFAAYDEIGRFLGQVDPPLPSERLLATEPIPPRLANQHAQFLQRAPLIRGTLDRIVMKAMEKDSARRYQTAEQLVGDLELHLKGAPVAIAGRHWHRPLRSAMKRHRRVLAVIVLLLAGGLFGALAMNKWRHETPIAASRNALSTEVTTSDMDSAPVRVAFSEGDTKLETVREGVQCFTNHNYTINHLPPEIIGMTFTQREHKKLASVEIDAPAHSTVYIMMNSESAYYRATAGPNARLAASGWLRLPDADFRIRYGLSVYKQSFLSPTHIRLDDPPFTGFIIAARKLTVADSPQNPAKTDSTATQP